MDKSKWEYKKLGEVCDFICSGGTPKRSNSSYWNGNIPWIKISNLTGSHVTSCDEYITEEGLNNSSAKLLSKGTILYSIFATIGAIGILDFEATTNQAIAGLKVKDEYDTNYIFYVLKGLRPYFEGISKGVAQNNINLSILRNKEIPIPPLSTQHQIVSELDQLSDLISLKQQQIKEYDALAQSLFYEMFGDPLSNDKNYECLKLGQLTKVGSSKRVFSTQLVDSGIPFFRGTEIAKIADGTFEDPTLFITKEHYENLIAVTGKPEVGDLLLPSICPNGRIMIVKDNKPFYIKDGRVLWIRANIKKFNSIYLKFALGKILTLDYNKYASGATFKELKIFTLSSVPIPLPPLSLQQSFASKVQSIEHQKSLLKQSIVETQTLLDSRMQEYFG